MMDWKEARAGSKVLGMILFAVMLNLANKVTLKRNRLRCGCLKSPAESVHIHRLWYGAAGRLAVMTCESCKSPYHVPMTWFGSSCIFIDSDRFWIAQRDKMISKIVDVEA